MTRKLSARCIELLDFAQKNADEAIKRHMDENLELLKLMRETIEKLVEVQGENFSLLTTVESQKHQLELDIAIQHEYMTTNKTLHSRNEFLMELLNKNSETMQMQITEIEKLQSQIDEMEQQMIIDIEQDELHRD